MRVSASTTSTSFRGTSMPGAAHSQFLQRGSHALSHEQVEEIREAFHLFDTNSTSTLMW